MNGYDILFIKLDENNEPVGGVISGENLRYLNVGYDPETFDLEVNSVPDGFAIVEDIGEILNWDELPLDPQNDFFWNEDKTRVQMALRKRSLTSEERAAKLQELTDNFNNTFGFESWVLNEEKYRYDPPIPYPSDGGAYHWRESDLSWVKLPAIPEELLTTPVDFDVETEQWVAIT